MDKTIYQSARLYLKENGKYRHLTSGLIATKVIGLHWEDRDVYPRKYPDDDEIKAHLGKPITEWPENNHNNGHQTDRLLKILYICPWYSKATGFGGLDEIKAVGFNAYHTYSPYQWWQNGWWNTPEGMKDNLRQVKEMLEELAKREMYGILQTPHGDASLRAMAELMGQFDNGFACTVEEPDCAPTNPPQPTLAQQKHMYDIIKDVSDIQVWSIFNGGDLARNCNMEAFNVIGTDSYCFGQGSGPVPGTPAVADRNNSLPWWKINPWIYDVKIPMMHRALPDDMAVVNIQQGFFNYSLEGHCLPNMQQEWDLYHEEFGLNSFGVYAHGAEQGGVHVMTDNRAESYSLPNQARALMKKLDEMEVK